MKVALLSAFGLSLILWVLLGYHVTHQLAAAQKASTTLETRYLHAQDALAAVRSEVLITSVIVRDAVLDTSVSTADQYRRDINRAYAAIDSAIASYVPVLGSPAEVQGVQRLKDAVANFRAASAEILNSDMRTWPVQARSLLRRYLPSREQAIAVSEEVQALNRTLYFEQQRTTAAGQARLQSQLFTGLGLGLAVNLAIALASSRYATRLERRLVDQRRREEQIGSDLQRLSARLVDIQDEEQRRIARDLHDEVGQGLTAIQLELVLARQRITRAGIDEDLLEDARTTTENVLRTVRDLSQLLHPPVLEDLGLCAALGSHIAALRKRTGLDLEFVDRTQGVRASPAVERTVYRALQEALTNVVRHARATMVTVGVRVESGWLVATVEDDGTGFDVATVERPGRRTGLGLLSIRERAAQVGGSVHITSRPGQGTRLEVRAPAPAAPAFEPRPAPVQLTAMEDARV
jgi:signal transduction histidine kinase